MLDWALEHRPAVLAVFLVFSLGSLGLVYLVGRDFFPTVDSGQIRLHAHAPAGTRIEKTELLFAEIEKEIRSVIPERELDTILDNIGLPPGGFNLAFGDSAAIGSNDGDILISLTRSTLQPRSPPNACASGYTRSFPIWCSSSKQPTSPTRF